MSHYSQIFLISLFLSLLCLQVRCLTADASLNFEADSNQTLLESLPRHYYSYLGQTIDDNGTYHIFAEYKGQDNSYRVAKIIKRIEMIVSFHEKNTFRVKILDQESTRWEIPEKDPYPHFQSNTTIRDTESCCEVHIEKDPFFSFFITRKDTGEIIFDTRNNEFLFSNYYIELSTALPTEYVYGFGVRHSKFKLSPGTYTIWGRDYLTIIEYGDGGGNTYSHHPVGLFRGQTGNFFMTFMRNSNAMDVIIQNNDNTSSLTYKMVGGVVDLIFFIGDTNPENVIKSYHNYIGKFTMMPFWSMGYHQSKWGYENHTILRDIITNYSSHNIPLDVIWSDIDYMIDKEVFTVDTVNFPPEQMKELFAQTKKKWVPIIYPCVAHYRSNGPGASEGLQRDVFLKNYAGKDLVGNLMSGPCYFPDFTHPDADKYWSDMLEHVYGIVPFSGIGLDMNEGSHFVHGEFMGKLPNTYDEIPYVPGGLPLKHKAIALDAKHNDGTLEYDVHNLFALLQNQVTHKYLQSKSKLPFLLTKGTTVGIGKYSAQRVADTAVSWEVLKYSIPGNFNFQIFGIPFVGTDICGYMDDVLEKICARWIQVGALYPFARNHKTLWVTNQEPWTFTDKNQGVSVIETTRASLKTRYAILKWYYSLFIETRGTGSIFRPLMFEFPQEDQLYQDGFGDTEFLLGKSVLCTPKVDYGEQPVLEAYFPKATWYELFTGHKFIDKTATERIREVQAPFNASAPLFLRGGHIIHRQAVDAVLSTEDLNNEFELIVALDRETDRSPLSAKGTMMGIEKYDDDSVYYRCMEGNCLYDINVVVTEENPASASVEIHVKRQAQNVKVPLDSFNLYGLKLYGLPLGFMEGDESKIGDGFVQIEREADATIADLVELVEIEVNAFQIIFKTPLEIRDGDVIKLGLLIKRTPQDTDL